MTRLGSTRAQILDQISFQKVELERSQEKQRAIMSEIIRLETKLYTQGEPLHNPRVCFNPILFSQKRCEQCAFHDRCVYEKKGR